MMNFFMLFSRVGNVFMAFVVGMTGTFILKVLFVIIYDHVLVGCRFRLTLFASIVSQEFVDQVPFLVLINVHISDWGKFLFCNFSPCHSSPMRFYTLHMPLVDHSNYSFSMTVLI